MQRAEYSTYGASSVDDHTCFICHAMQVGSSRHALQQSRGVVTSTSIDALLGSHVVPASMPPGVSTVEDAIRTSSGVDAPESSAHVPPPWPRPGAIIRSPTAVLKPPHENLAGE